MVEQHRLFGREVAKDGAATDIRGLRNVLEGRFRVAAGQEE
jgi:hypothetical protein